MLGPAHRHADEKQIRTVCPVLLQLERDEYLVSYRVLSKRSRHRRLSLPQSSSASRFTAGAAGFLNFNQ